MYVTEGLHAIFALYQRDVLFLPCKGCKEKVTAGDKQEFSV
jgi:hypothetical protein